MGVAEEVAPRGVSAVKEQSRCSWSKLLCRKMAPNTRRLDLCPCP